MMRLLTALSIIIVSITFLGDKANANNEIEYPDLVSVFQSVCLKGGVDPTKPIAVLENLDGWHEQQDPVINVKNLGISKSINGRVYFGKTLSQREWSGKINDKDATFLIASLKSKKKYKNICAVIIEDAKNAIPYADATKEAFATFGMKRKSVDLAHYFEFTGKLKPNKHRVRGEIFSRSQVGYKKETMHIYIAY